jgi:phosphate transport system substrate-binding protein
MSAKRGYGGIILFCALLALISSCKQETNNKSERDSSNHKIYKGTLNIDADAGLEAVIRQQKEVFEFYYDSVKLNINYTDEKNMLSDFGNHKAELMVFSRFLDDAEKEHLKTADTVYTREITVAYDAIAIVAGTGFSDSTLSVNRLKEYFNPVVKKNGEKPELVFDNSNSSVVKYMLHFLGNDKQVSSNVYAVKGDAEVLNYVQKNKNAIGFIPFNFISDTDDDSIKQIYERIKVLSLHEKGPGGKAMIVSANQSDISTGDYPLKRAINVVVPYGYRDDIGWLFANFLLTGKGSKIFLKHGLVPAKRSEREIKINTEGLKGIN